MTETTQEPTTFTSVTPSGIEIRYSPKPKRMYEVRPAAVLPSGGWPWQEVPSVTTVLGVLDKPGLPWWGMKVGVEGVLELVKSQHLVGAVDGCYLAHNLTGWDGYATATPESVVQLLTEEKLTVNHVRDKAGDRGVAVHDAFETWAKTGQLPDPAIYPESEAGYVAGLVGFLEDVRPEPIEAEVMVGSVEHGFAGRYDIRLRVTKECNVVFHRTPKRGPQYARLKPGVILADLKTSKQPYPTHALQLIAYEMASVECGYEASMARGVLHVTADGHYQFKRTNATPDDFLAVLRTYQVMQRAKEWL